MALGGDSLVLAGVAALLESDERFRIVITDIQVQGIVARLEATSAHVLIVDLNVVPPEEALALVRRCHDLTLIGLEPGGGHSWRLGRTDPASRHARPHRARRAGAGLTAS